MLNTPSNGVFFLFCTVLEAQRNVYRTESGLSPRVRPLDGLLLEEQGVLRCSQKSPPCVLRYVID